MNTNHGHHIPGTGLASVKRRFDCGGITACRTCFVEAAEKSPLTTVTAKNYVSLMEASKIVGISRQAMQQRVQMGHVAAIKVGAAYIIDEAILYPRIKKWERK